MLEKYLSDIAVLGAGGKMGSGITLVLLQDRVFNSLEKEGAITGFTVRAMDVNSDALEGLRYYLKKQLSKVASKKLEKLRFYFKLNNDEEIIQKFVDNSLNQVQFVTDLKELGTAKLIFEAIIESVEVKTKVYKELKEITHNQAFYLTNTSSIPISILDEQAQLEHRIIGFHFYNPPPVQKLVEVISSENTNPELVTLANELGKQLGKILVPSNDIAGFIGNGHFMRDLLFGLQLFDELRKEHGDAQSIWMINRVSQDFMIRPMGIFQLMDYVGLDVCQSILTIMRTYLKDDSLHHPVLDEMVARGVKGGQNPDGSQKNGFLQYDGRNIDGIYSLTDKQYVPLTDELNEKVNALLGPLPEKHLSWKEMLKNEDRHETLKQYFKNLKEMDTIGSKLAWRYLLRSRKIAEKLVEDNVANSADDVNNVLMYGFYHLYGPINDFIISP